MRYLVLDITADRDDDMGYPTHAVLPLTGAVAKELLGQMDLATDVARAFGDVFDAVRLHDPYVRFVFDNEDEVLASALEAGVGMPGGSSLIAVLDELPAGIADADLEMDRAFVRPGEVFWSAFIHHTDIRLTTTTVPRSLVSDLLGSGALGE